MDTQMITKEKSLPRSTNFQTTIKLIKVTIGSGIFAIPYAYAQAGLFWGIILQLLVCATQYISWCIMVNCLGDAKRSTLIQYLSEIYSESSWMFLIGKIFSIILNFGCGLSYVILFQISIGSYFQNSLQCKLVIFFFLFIILFGFSFARDLQIFVPILNLISFTYLSILAISELQKWQLTESNTEKVMIAFDIMIFAYDMNGILTEIRIEMEDTSQFQKCLFQAMAFETILFQFFGITIIYYHKLLRRIQTQLFNINYFVNLMITYVSILIVNTLMPNYLIIHEIPNNQQQIKFKVVYVLCQMLIAFIYPNFAIVLSIMGCICCVTLGYVIPYYMTFRFIVEPLYQIINTVVVLFGIIGGFYGLIGCFS